MQKQRKIRKVAIVHDWLPLYGGAERVLEEIIKIFPGADIYSLIDHLEGEDRHFLGGKPVHTSFVQGLPWGRTKYRHYFALMPLAIEQFDLSAYDLVLSSSYAFAKGVITGPHQLHICYCHSPMRYAWDLQHQYLEEAGLRRGLRSAVARMILHYLRIWDVRTSHGVDHFVANSRFVAQRIEKIYRREARVIYPSIECSDYSVLNQKEDFYLSVSRLVPYKRIPLIIEAFRGMPDRRLVIIGDGPERARIVNNKPANVEFLGWQTTAVVRDYLRRAKALVYPAEEDFGIVPVEAQACGTPVIGYGRGGLTETAVEGETGVFFMEQTSEAIRFAVDDFENRKGEFDANRIRRNAERFSVSRFRAEFAEFVAEKLEEFAAGQRTAVAKSLNRGERISL